MRACRSANPDYERVEANRYGYASATLRVEDVGQGFKVNFVFCPQCRSRFILVWPKGLKVVPCLNCDFREVRTRDTSRA